MHYLITATHDDLQNGSAYAAYIDYLDSIKVSLPSHVYDYARAEWHYNFGSPKCPHDAWLNNLVIIEQSEGLRHEIRSCNIQLYLLGAYHDRIFKFSYSDVLSYEINNPFAAKGHGDLLIDEIALSKNSKILHSLRFSSGALITIECSDFVLSEEPT